MALTNFILAMTQKIMSCIEVAYLSISYIFFTKETKTPYMQIFIRKNLIDLSKSQIRIHTQIKLIKKVEEKGTSLHKY